MKYLLDTNICIYLIRRKAEHLIQKFAKHEIGDIGISIITVAELQYGVHRSSRPVQNNEALEGFLVPLTILDFDYAASAAYGRIRATLEAAGRPIGSWRLLQEPQINHFLLDRRQYRMSPSIRPWAGASRVHAEFFMLSFQLSSLFLAISLEATDLPWFQQKSLPPRKPVAVLGQSWDLSL